MDCVFCSITQKNIPAQIVFENNEILAFLDNKPVNQGHVLVIPKKHYEDLFALPDDVLAKLSIVGKQVSAAVMKVTHADGLNVEMNNKPAAGQIVFHSHLHLIPRFLNDGFRHWPRKETSEQELKQISEKIASELSQVYSY